MTRHYHQIWTTLQVANQQWKQWLQTNSKQPFYPISTNTTSTNNDLAPFATSAENMSLVELEMEIVNELEQSLSEIDSGNGSYQLDSNYNGETVFSHDLGARNSQWTSNSTTTTSSTNSCVDSKEDDYTLLHTDNHRNVCKTIDFILDQDAKSLSKMKQSWQQLQQWSRQCVEKKRKWSNNLFKYSSSRTIREDSYATPNSRREQQDIQGW